MRAGGLDAEQKTSISDVVTAADHAAERVIVDTLAVERPDDGVLGEEGSARDGQQRAHLGDRPRRRHLQLRGRASTGGAPPSRCATASDLVLGCGPPPRQRDVVRRGAGPARRRPTACRWPRWSTARWRSRAWRPTCTRRSCGADVEAAFGRAARRAATLRMLGSGSMDAMAVASGIAARGVPALRAAVGRAARAPRSSAPSAGRPVTSRPRASAGTSPGCPPRSPRSAPRSPRGSLLAP